MNYFEIYMKKINEELHPDQLKGGNKIEIIGNNVYGTLGGKDIGTLKADEFYNKIKTTMPPLYRAIEAKGGLDFLRGNDTKVDIIIHDDGKITINPDKKV